MPLENLGPYKLEKLLGRGGMGAVYVGLHRETGEQAAVKVLSGHLADDEFFQERFKQEIETLKRLLHPNIVQLHGFGEDEGQLYYVMELVNGRNLQDELKAGRRFTWREVTRIGIAVSQALKHAHDRGIIHRDLKPANLMLDPQDFVKLTDFGIAKLYGGANVTAEGGVLGTADYMAPEQAEGKAVTARCDLYALGSVLHALLAGKPPFAGRTVIEVITSLKNDKPTPVRRLAPDTPVEFEKIILQLLEKDPQQRIPTALALGNRLKAMEHGLSMETRILNPSQDDGDANDPKPADPRPAVDKTLSLERASDVTDVIERRKSGEEYRVEANAPTLASDPKGGVSSRTSLGTQVSKPTGAGSDSGRGTESGRASSSVLAEAAPPAKTKRFTTITEQELRGARETEDSSLKQWALGGGLALVVLTVIAGVVLFAARSPSADRLYATVKQAADAGDADELLAVETELERFIATYSADSRADEMRALQDELARYRLQKRLESRARRGAGSEGLSPVERTYLEALQLSATDPEQALARFEALLSVFGGAPDPSQSLKQKLTGDQCLELARQQAQRLRGSLDKINAQETTAIRRQLDRADKLAQKDRPAAQRIWQGIVTLYRGKAWAQELVAQAESRLADASHSSP